MTKKPRKPSTPGSFRNVRTTNPPHQHIIKFRLRDNAWPPAKMLDFPFRKHEERVTFDDLVTDLKNDYQVNGKGSLKTVGYYLAHMRVFFGLDRAIDISPDKIRAYQSQRLGEGAAHATVNREVATLGRMLSLAVGAGKLSRKLRFQMLAENNVRQGFLEHGDFLTLLANLPDHLKPLVESSICRGGAKVKRSSLNGATLT